MKHTSKRLTSLFLALAMVFSLLCGTAWASEGVSPDSDTANLKSDSQMTVLEHDSFSTAAPLALETSVSDSFSSSSEEHYYSFTIPEDGYIVTELTYEDDDSYDSFSSLWYLDLYDSGQRTISKKRYAGEDGGVKTSTKIGLAAGTYKTISKLTKNKTYYVRIRTYKTVSDKKYYSGWSEVKSVKIKK